MKRRWKTPTEQRKAFSACNEGNTGIKPPKSLICNAPLGLRPVDNFVSNPDMTIDDTVTAPIMDKSANISLMGNHSYKSRTYDVIHTDPWGLTRAQMMGLASATFWG
jgi:hypothetical protein